MTNEGGGTKEQGGTKERGGSSHCHKSIWSHNKKMHGWHTGSQGREAAEGGEPCRRLRKAGDVKLRTSKPGRIPFVTGVSTCRVCPDLNTVCRPRWDRRLVWKCRVSSSGERTMKAKGHYVAHSKHTFWQEKSLLWGWSRMTPINFTNLQLSFAAFQHFTVSCCQWGILPLAFVIFQIFHSSETKDQQSNTRGHAAPSYLFILTILMTAGYTLPPTF